VKHLASRGAEGLSTAGKTSRLAKEGMAA
jgi:hypothetical protein